MPTYAELETEAVYRAEYEPAALAAFNNRLRVHFGHDRTQTTSRGDNRHLTGRHRSRAWVATSRFCTNRSYGTRDGRDTRGPANALRATDVGLQGQALRDASARMDAAVRAGLLPEIAEWFGTVDGRTVIGWFEGHASSSDSSHLYHLHLGYWTEQTENAAFFDRLFAVITGTGTVKEIIDMGMQVLAKDLATGKIWLCDGMSRRIVANSETDRAVTDLKYLAQQGAISVFTGESAGGETRGSIWQGVSNLMGLPVDAVAIDHDKLASLIVAKLPPTALTTADVKAALADVLLHGATPE